MEMNEATIGFGVQPKEKPWYLDSTKSPYWYLEGRDVTIMTQRGKTMDVFLETVTSDKLYFFTETMKDKEVPLCMSTWDVSLIGPTEKDNQLELKLGEKENE